MILKIIQQINQMFDKIQMILMMKTSISNNCILRLNKDTYQCLIHVLITRMIVIDISLLIARCFLITLSLISNSPLLKDIKVFVGLLWLISNHMLGLGSFKISKNALGQFIQNCPPKHVITCTKLTARATRIFSLSVLWHVYCNLWLHSAYEFSVFINLYLLGTVSNHLTGKTWSIN